jgi:hypothetical protein
LEKNQKQNNQEQQNREELNKPVSMFSSFSSDLQIAMLKQAENEGAKHPRAYVEGKLRNGWEPDIRLLLGSDHPEVRASNKKDWM